MKNATFRCSLEDLVLAWLVTPREQPGRSALVDALAPMFEGDRVAAKKEIERVLQELDAKGYMDQKKPREQNKPPLRLSDAGRRTALNILTLPELPSGKDWTWTKKVLWLRRVGLTYTPALEEKARNAGWRAARMLELSRGIPSRENFTLADVLDELFWPTLTGKWPGGSLGHAIAESGLHVVPTPPDPVEEPSGPKPPEPRPPEPPVDLETFARRVNEAALAAPTGRWLNDKVFISHVYEELKRRHQTEGWTPEEFKRQLLQAHKARLVRLKRADFVGALPQGDVLSSKTEDGEHTFHFVRIDHLGQVDVSGARGAGRPR